MRTPAAGASGLARSGQRGGETGGEKCCHPHWLFPSQNDSGVAKRKRWTAGVSGSFVFSCVCAPPATNLFIRESRLHTPQRGSPSLCLRWCRCCFKAFKGPFPGFPHSFQPRQSRCGLFFPPYVKTHRSYNNPTVG